MQPDIIILVKSGSSKPGVFLLFSLVHVTYIPLLSHIDLYSLDVG